MNLKNLITTLNEGHVALGSKLANLLTEDCVILEYTSNSVLFIKEGKLVSATFKLNESGQLNADGILDNEVVTISAKSLNKTLRSKLATVIENIATKDLVSADENLASFCETFYQFSTLKSKCPELFAESLAKTNKGFSIRKKAFDSLAKFRAAVFNAVVVEESISDDDLATLASVVEAHGVVLALGKEKVKRAISESLFGNSVLAGQITNYLYTIAEGLDNNEDLNALDKSYDLEAGKFPDEDLEGEDLAADEDSALPDLGAEDEESIPEVDDENAAPEFEPFDPSTLSEEEVKELHKATLVGILNAIRDFVVDKANSIDDANVSPDLDEKIDQDIESLTDPDVSDARLSEIEARWQPMIGYFLDSEYHTPETLTDEFGADDIDATVSSNNSEDVSNMDTDLNLNSENEPPVGGEDLPPVDGDLNPAETGLPEEKI